ncbi:unnamed protein product, partial [Toxocara canis]|uniref:DOMON domain-containing protein n=1 Tax=Toxocara canis TaxID=6265 RepID=A0A183U1R9_TOXCA
RFVFFLFEGSCGSNEEFTKRPEFSRQCEASCDWTRYPETIPNCPRSCGTPKCICKEGFVRAANDNDTCVPFRHCSDEVEIECPANSTWAKCGTACEPTCENMYDTSPCPARCDIPACTCADNYVRYNVECIFWGDCPSNVLTVTGTRPTTVTPPSVDTLTCGINETINDCGRACESDCITCDACAKPACACIQGYARMEDKCIYWGDCTLNGSLPRTSTAIGVIGDVCYGDWRWPVGCRDCDYRVSWNYLDDTDEIEFSVETRAPSNWWTGIGFSPTGTMVEADMIIVKSRNGELTLHDMYSVGYGPPREDSEQNVYTPTVVGTHVNGVLRAQFTRRRDTGDRKADHRFSDTSCYKFLFPVSGGRLDPVSSCRCFFRPISEELATIFKA